MNEKMYGRISTMQGIFCRLPFQKGGITAGTIAAQDFDGGIFSVDTRHVGVKYALLRRIFIPTGQKYVIRPLPCSSFLN